MKKMLLIISLPIFLTGASTWAQDTDPKPAPPPLPCQTQAEEAKKYSDFKDFLKERKSATSEDQAKNFCGAVADFLKRKSTARSQPDAKSQTRAQETQVCQCQAGTKSSDQESSASQPSSGSHAAAPANSPALSPSQLQNVHDMLAVNQKLDGPDKPDMKSDSKDDGDGPPKREGRRGPRDDDSDDDDDDTKVAKGRGPNQVQLNYSNALIGGPPSPNFFMSGLGPSQFTGGCAQPTMGVSNINSSSFGANMNFGACMLMAMGVSGMAPVSAGFNTSYYPLYLPPPAIAAGISVPTAAGPFANSSLTSYPLSSAPATTSTLLLQRSR